MSEEDPVLRRELDSMRDYIDAVESRATLKIDALTYQVSAAFEASQRAIDKADEATEKRFEGVNEFRAALADQATRFVTLDQLKSTGDKLEAGYLRNREDIERINQRLDLGEGQEAGSRLTRGNIIAYLATFAAIIGVLVVLANYASSH